jgi:hypothetical protein
MSARRPGPVATACVHATRRAFISVLIAAGLLAACAHQPEEAPNAPVPRPPVISPRPAPAQPALATPAQPAPAPSAQPAPAPSAPAGFPAARYAPGAEQGGRVYEVAPAESQLDVLVYRAGRLQRFGHNHIVTSRDVHGFAFDAQDPSRSHFDIWFPVDTMSVDEPELRVAEGDAFSSQPTENDIAGTRRNMLGDKMLNAAQFPHVTIGGRATGGAPDAPAFDLTITVRGIAHTIPATAKVEHDGDTLRATGEVRLSHAALGLEPFSVLGGALSVEDAFDVRYRITAHAR